MREPCNENEIIRKSYTRKGSRVPATCIRKVTPYPKKYSNFQTMVLKRMTQRLRGIGKSKRGNTKKCRSGKILRKAYVRFSKKGKRSLVKGSCITKKGKPQIILRKIGPLRKGDLSQFGYVKIMDLTKEERHTALRKAIAKYGTLSIWKKINVLYVYNKNTNPELSSLYNEDRNWIKDNYELKAPTT